MSMHHVHTGRRGSRIVLRHPRQVRDWCWVLGCDERQLRDGIAAVGNDVDAIKQWLTHHAK